MPRALFGSPAADVFRHLVRMNDGPAHASRKPAVSATVDVIDPQALATTIAAAGVTELLRAGVDVERLPAAMTYRPSAGARVPVFRAM